MSGKHLLCVDDEPSTLNVRKAVLEASGYSVLTASSAQDALNLLADGTVVDMVLLDYLMPQMNGDELAQKLRGQYPNLPLLVVSAVGKLPPALLKITDGAILKGRDPEVLLSTIAEILHRHDKRDDSSASVQKTILCVEDEELQLKARQVLFESAGYRVFGVQSATAAMDTFRSNHVDAVVMDYWLSGQRVNGTALANQMKRLHPRIPIVMLSGFVSLPGESAVVDAWIRKSEIEPESLLQEVRRLIQLRTLPQSGRPK